MADVNAVDLTTETLTTLDGNENVVLFDTAEGKKVTLKVLADYIVQKATESLTDNGSTTVKDAISQLDQRTGALAMPASYTRLIDYIPTLKRGHHVFMTSGLEDMPEPTAYYVFSVHKMNSTAGNAQCTIEAFRIGVNMTRYYAYLPANATSITWSGENLAHFGLPIPNNADLNDYTTPGKYYSSSSSVTATLSHCPLTGAGFSLYVLGLASANLKQIYIHNTDGDTMYMRQYSNSSGTFGSWIKLSTRSEIDSIQRTTAQKGWGTSFTFTTNNTAHGILLLGNTYNVRVWGPSTTEVNIIVQFVDADNNFTYVKKGPTGEVTFGATETATSHKITRNGSTYTVTVPANTTMTWIGY